MLVSEAEGVSRHGVFHVDADAGRVYTFEVPEGFSLAFVIACERRERRAA